MTTVVDIYGTLSNSFAGYDSDNLYGYKKDDLIVKDGKIYIATTDIPIGTVFSEADSEGQIQAWLPQLTGIEAGAAIGTVNDSDVVVIFDSEFATKSITDLADVDTFSSTPTHGQTLVWNAVSGNWVPGQIATTEGEGAVGATLRKDSYTYTGTNAFILSYEPFGEISGYRNGVSLPAGSVYTDSDGTGLDSDSEITWIAVYVPAANDSDELVVGDRIDIQYIFNDPAQVGITFGMLKDIDFLTTAPKHHQQVIYDSDADRWVPAKIKQQDKLVYAVAGQSEFLLDELAVEVTGFYRNGMRLINTAWDSWDSDVTVVNYVYENNGYSLMADSDEVQITYNRITE